jgi:nudix-type nucleoside diphosphatase (YffH/AdpP family)
MSAPALANPRVRITRNEVLSDNWYVLRKITFDYQRRDGTWQTQAREAYDRGDGAALLPYDPETRSVILTRQFRMPTYVNGNPDGMLIEACAGLLDGEGPEACIRREAEEEIGFRVERVVKVGELYTAPGAVTEVLHLFVAEYTAAMRVAGGGGMDHEHEDIEVLELPFDLALAMVDSGQIRDAKTVLLLRHAERAGLLAPPRPLHVLVAGPYRSGTGDDPAKIAENLAAMNHAALEVYRRGHLPAVGEWYALPLLEAAGSQAMGDAAFEEIFHPSAERLLARCDAVLRIGGASQGADAIVSAARDMGKRVFLDTAELPAAPVREGAGR